MNRKRRNIHIIPSLGYGGAESFLLRLIPNIEEENIVITLYHTQYDKERIKDKKLKYISLDLARTSILDIKTFLKLILSLNCNDTILSWLYIADLFASILKILFFWKKFKVIWNVRNTVIKINEYSIIAFISFSICRIFLMQIPKNIIFNSKESMLQHLKKGYSKQKSLIIYNGFTRYVSLKKLNNEKNSFNIICVARYHPQKNHKLLFKSIETFKQHYCFNFKLHLVGKGLNTKNEGLIKHLKKLNIYNNVILHDLISPITVHELFSQSDISLLLSSYGESFPNVIAEAMLYGTFPIATDVGDTKSIIASFGETVPKNTTAEKIANLIYNYYLLKNNNFEDWRKKKKECLNFAENRFSIEKSAKKFKEIIYS